MSVNFQINKTYTFNTLAPAILGSVFKNAVLESIHNYESASKIENVRVKYQQVYPALPVGSPSSPAGVTWYRFVTESGEKVMLADSMIDGSSASEVTGITFTVTVVNASSQDKANVAASMAHLGVDFAITDA